MFLPRTMLLVGTGLVLAACTGSAPPSPFSNAVKTDSGLAATGSAGPNGGAGAPPSNSGGVTTTNVR